MTHWRPAMQRHAALFSARHGLALIFRFRRLKAQWIHTCMAICIFYLQEISLVERLLNWLWHRHGYSYFASISKAKIIFTCLLATWKPLQSEWFNGTAMLHLYIHLVILKPTKHVVILTKENSASDVAWTQHNFTSIQVIVVSLYSTCRKQPAGRTSKLPF